MNTCLKEIDRVSEQLDAAIDVSLLRTTIAELIARCLLDRREALGYWEKAHIVAACDALLRDMRLQASTAWLPLCLHHLRQVFLPTDKRHDTDAPRYPAIETLSFDELAAMVGRATTKG